VVYKIKWMMSMIFIHRAGMDNKLFTVWDQLFDFKSDCTKNYSEFDQIVLNAIEEMMT
jgi:hypothetical protein